MSSVVRKDGGMGGGGIGLPEKSSKPLDEPCLILESLLSASTLKIPEKNRPLNRLMILNKKLLEAQFRFFLYT